MKYKTVAVSIITLLTIALVPNSGIAQVESDEAADWAELKKRFSEDSRFYHEHIVVSEATFSAGIVKALARMNEMVKTKEEYSQLVMEEDTSYSPDFTSASSVVSSHKFGNITVTHLDKSFSETVSEPDSAESTLSETNNLAIQILFSNDKGAMLLKYFEEEADKNWSSTITIAHEGLTFSDLIREMTRIGIEIDQQTVPTASYVTLRVPSELLGYESGSRSMKELEKDLYEQLNKN